MIRKIKIALAFRAMEKARIAYIKNPIYENYKLFLKAQDIHYFTKYPNACLSAMWSV